MPWDEDKWNSIVAQWDADDEEEAKDDLESGKDAYDLAQPSTWAEQDAPRPAAQALAREAAQGIKPKAPDMPAPEEEPTRPPPARIAVAREVDKPVTPPPVEGLDWKGLQDRLRNAELRAMQTRAASNMFANIVPGYHADLEGAGEQVKAARMPLELAKEKQGMESRQLSMDTQRAASGVKAAMDNPNSLQSQKAREAWVAFGMSKPAGFDNWSANDVQRFLASGQSDRAARAKDADDAAKARAGADKAAGEKASLEASRKNFAKELQALGIDPDNASQKDIDRAIQLKESKSRLALAQAGEGRKQQEQKALGETIPFAGGELRYTGSGTPREEDKREAQKVASSYGAALAGMDDMDKRLQEFARNPTPETKEALNSSAQITAGHLNTAYGQGAMSKEEAENMAKTLGASFTPAGGFQFVVDKLIGDDPAAAHTLQRRLQSARRNTKAAAMAKVRAYRFDMPEEAPQETPPIPGAEDVRVINGKTYRKRGDKWVTDA